MRCRCASPLPLYVVLLLEYFGRFGGELDQVGLKLLGEQFSELPFDVLNGRHF